jgi:ribonuclease HI
VYVDAAHGPGGSSWGALVEVDGGTVALAGVLEHARTSVEAEIAAVWSAMAAARERWPDARLHVYTDCRAAARTMGVEWKRRTSWRMRAAHDLAHAVA